MKYRRLGKSDLTVSEVSLGCWTLGGLNWVNGQANGWANADEEEVTKAVKEAVDAGVNHFDNADVYGNGQAERMLARVLKRLGLKSEDFVIATKIGHFPGTAAHAYESAHIRHQCEQSLINLGRDYIDVYYFHHDNFGEFLHSAAAVMDDLINEGKVRVKGQSGYNSETLCEAIKVVEPEVVQSWANMTDYPFIGQDTPVGKLMAEKELSFVAFSPLGQGLLLDKFDPENPPAFEEGDHRRGSAKFGADHLRRLKPMLAQIKERFGDSTETLSAVAQRFILDFPNVACTIPGFRNEWQVECNLEAVSFDLSDEDHRFLKKLFEPMASGSSN